MSGEERARELEKRAEELFKVDYIYRERLRTLGHKLCSVENSGDSLEGRYLVATEDIEKNVCITGYPMVILILPQGDGTSAVEVNPWILGIMEPGLREQFLTALRERADLRSVRRYQVDLEDGIKSAVGTEEMAGMIKHMLEADNTVGHYANHSDEPNAQIGIFRVDKGYGLKGYEIAIVALKPIKKGSKITVNYGPAYWKGLEQPVDFAGAGGGGAKRRDSKRGPGPWADGMVIHYKLRKGHRSWQYKTSHVCR